MSWNVEADGFFVQVPEWLEESTVSDKGFRLWVRLYRLAQAQRHTGKPFPGRQGVAELMGWSESTTDRVLKELERLQALHIKRTYNVETKRYLPSTYRVLTAIPQPVDKGGVSSDATPSPDATPGVSSDDASSREENLFSDAEKAPAPPPATPLSSRRSSGRPRASRGPRTTGLTPGPTPTPLPPAPACPSSDADELARKLFAEVRPALAKSVRELRPELAQLLENGFTVEQIEAAARHPECRSWKYGALVFIIRTPKPPAGARTPTVYVPVSETPSPPVDREAVHRMLRAKR